MSSGENPFGRWMTAGRESAEAGENGRNARTAASTANSTPSDFVAARGWDMEEPFALPRAPSPCTNPTSATFVGYWAHGESEWMVHRRRILTASSHVPTGSSHVTSGPDVG